MGVILILFTSTASAYNPYGDVYEYNLYFNGKLLNTTEVPKPVLKIGEPFDVKIDFAIYKKCEMSIKLSEIEKGYFVILNGSTPKMDVYRADVVEKNSTITYEWTVKPTENGREDLCQLILFIKLMILKQKIRLFMVHLP